MAAASKRELCRERVQKSCPLFLFFFCASPASGARATPPRAQRDRRGPREGGEKAEQSRESGTKKADESRGKCSMASRSLLKKLKSERARESELFLSFFLPLFLPLSQPPLLRALSASLFGVKEFVVLSSRYKLVSGVLLQLVFCSFRCSDFGMSLSSLSLLQATPPFPSPPPTLPLKTSAQNACSRGTIRAET